MPVPYTTRAQYDNRPILEGAEEMDDPTAELLSSLVEIHEKAIRARDQYPDVRGVDWESANRVLDCVQEALSEIVVSHSFEDPDVDYYGEAWHEITVGPNRVRANTTIAQDECLEVTRVRS